MVRSDQETAIETYAACFCASVVSEQASAIGITAVPTPFTDIGSDKIFVYANVFGRLAADSGAGFKSEMGRSTQIESKAMRKVVDGEDVAFVLETPALSAGVVATIYFRMLIKLH